MRARSPVVAAIVLLMSVAPAQADALAGGLSRNGAGADVAMQEWRAADVCVDISTLFEDPLSAVILADQCTFTASVSVDTTDEGGVVVTIVVTYAEYGYSVVLDCTDPQHLPQPGETWSWYGPCSVQELTRWMT